MFITTNNQVFNSLGRFWITCMKDVILQGQAINDGKDSLIEIANYYAAITSIDENDSIILQYADKERMPIIEYKYLNCNVHPNYKISYGKLLFDNNGINQIDWIIRCLKSKMETKSATISLHSPGETELSCLSVLDFKYRNNLLHMNVVYRSQNVFASQPGNILVLRKIQNNVAKELNISVGNMEIILLSAHIYNQDVDKVKQILKDYRNRYQEV